MTASATPQVESAAVRARRLDRTHVFHSWSAQAELNPMMIQRAQGAYVWDENGNRLLDFSSQLVNTNIGHQHPRVVAAIQAQAAKLCTVAPQHVNDVRSEAARLIADRTPGDLNRIFFTNGGADANEHAVRMARLVTGRYKVLSAYRSYHGGTTLAVNLTGDPRRWPNDHGNTGTLHFWAPFLYRSAFHASDEQEECDRALEHLDQLIAFEGPSSIAAVVLETIPGTAGIMVPPAGYIKGVRALCDKYGTLLIVDEVMCGFGRAGLWFAIDEFGVTPDMLTFAKGVNSGYVPLGGVAISEKVAGFFDRRVYPGGLTYSGHPLATAAAVATIETMEEEQIVQNAARVGREVIGPALEIMRTHHPSVGEIRGRGVFWALELVKDRQTKEPMAPWGGTTPVMVEITASLRTAGLLPFVNFNRIHIVPPCTITDDQAREGLRLIDAALCIADAQVTGGWT